MESRCNQYVGWIHRNQCDMCNSNRFTILLSREYSKFVEPDSVGGYDIPQKDYKKWFLRVPIPFNLMKCNCCGFVFHEYILNDEGMNKLYSKWVNIPLLQKRRKSESFEKHAKKTGDYLNKIMFAQEYLNTTSLKLLDYGGGFGDFANMAAVCGCISYISELSSEKVNQRGCTFLPKVITVGSEEDDFFDVINLSQVLEHVPSPSETMRHIYRILKPGGIVFIDVPRLFFLRKHIKKCTHGTTAPQAFSPPQHVNLFCNGTLKKVLLKSGFRLMFRPFSEWKWRQKGTLFDIARAAISPFSRYKLGTALMATKP